MSEVETDAEDHRRAAAPAHRRGGASSQAARLEVDKVLALFYDPYSVRRCRTSCRPSADGGRARAALKRRRGRRCERAETGGRAGAEAQGDADAQPRAPAAFRPGRAEGPPRHPGQPRAARQDLRPGGPTGAAVGDMNITVGGDIDVTKDAGRAAHAHWDRSTPCAGTYQFQGRRFDLVRGGTVRFTGEPQINPHPRRDRDHGLIPNTGVEARVQITGTLEAPQLKLDEHSAARRVRHPRADRLQPAGQRAGHRRARLAGGDGGRDRRAASSRRRSASRSAARSTSISSRSRRPADDRRRGAGDDRRPAGRRPRVLQAAPAVRRAHDHRVHARVSARRLPAPAGHRRARNDGRRPTASASAASSAPASI